MRKHRRSFSVIITAALVLGHSIFILPVWPAPATARTSPQGTVKIKCRKGDTVEIPSEGTGNVGGHILVDCLTAVEAKDFDSVKTVYGFKFVAHAGSLGRPECAPGNPVAPCITKSRAAPDITYTVHEYIDLKQSTSVEKSGAPARIKVAFDAKKTLGATPVISNVILGQTDNGSNALPKLKITKTLLEGEVKEVSNLQPAGINGTIEVLLAYDAAVLDFTGTGLSSFDTKWKLGSAGSVEVKNIQAVGSANAPIFYKGYRLQNLTPTLSLVNVPPNTIDLFGDFVLGDVIIPFKKLKIEMNTAKKGILEAKDNPINLQNGVLKDALRISPKTISAVVDGGGWKLQLMTDLLLKFETYPDANGTTIKEASVRDVRADWAPDGQITKINFELPGSKPNARQFAKLETNWIHGTVALEDKELLRQGNAWVLTGAGYWSYKYKDEYESYREVVFNNMNWRAAADGVFKYQSHASISRSPSSNNVLRFGVSFALNLLNVQNNPSMTQVGSARYLVFRCSGVNMAIPEMTITSWRDTNASDECLVVGDDMAGPILPGHMKATISPQNMYQFTNLDLVFRESAMNDSDLLIPAFSYTMEGDGTLLNNTTASTAIHGKFVIPLSKKYPDYTFGGIIELAASAPQGAAINRLDLIKVTKAKVGYGVLPIPDFPILTRGHYMAAAGALELHQKVREMLQNVWQIGEQVPPLSGQVHQGFMRIISGADKYFVAYAKAPNLTAKLSSFSPQAFLGGAATSTPLISGASLTISSPIFVRDQTNYYKLSGEVSTATNLFNVMSLPQSAVPIEIKFGVDKNNSNPKFEVNFQLMGAALQIAKNGSPLFNSIGPITADFKRIFWGTGVTPDARELAMITDMRTALAGKAPQQANAMDVAASNAKGIVSLGTFSGQNWVIYPIEDDSSTNVPAKTIQSGQIHFLQTATKTAPYTLFIGQNVQFQGSATQSSFAMLHDGNTNTWKYYALNGVGMGALVSNDTVSNAETDALLIRFNGIAKQQNGDPVLVVPPAVARNLASEIYTYMHDLGRTGFKNKYAAVLNFVITGGKNTAGKTFGDVFLEAYMPENTPACVKTATEDCIEKDKMIDEVKMKAIAKKVQAHLCFAFTTYAIGNLSGDTTETVAEWYFKNAGNGRLEMCENANGVPCYGGADLSKIGPGGAATMDESLVTTRGQIPGGLSASGKTYALGSIKPMAKDGVSPIPFAPGWDNNHYYLIYKRGNDWYHFDHASPAQGATWCRRPKVDSAGNISQEVRIDNERWIPAPEYKMAVPASAGTSDYDRDGANADACKAKSVWRVRYHK